VPSPTLIEKCCLVAYPVAGNPTQYLVEQAFTLKGLDWRFMTFEVEPPRLGDAMRGIRALGFHGVKIGEPFHQTVIEHLDALSERAKKCGSVNLIANEGERLVGDNTEGAAVVELVRQQANLVGKRAMVIGAGRLARAIAVALADAGLASIAVACRSGEKGDKLVELIGQQTAAAATLVPLSGAFVTVDPQTVVLVNATSLSTLDAGAKLPIDATSLDPKLIVVDVAYNASHTWLTRQAAERGCRTIDGLAIFVQQTALAFQAWTGLSPDTAPMREAAEEFLGI
jgi:shikimate dehydrogenase